ncbi:MAG: 3-oxoacyl-ACP synthase III family protein [Oligoflexia bacterium]|nr:3-oxoacyl-ACP synthase III family protein [Oligoflexia bacterium]
MKPLEPQLKLNIRGYGRAWPGKNPITNTDLLRRNPETTDKSAEILAGLDLRISRGFGFKTRYMTHFPGEPLTGAEETSESLALQAVTRALGDSAKDVAAFVLGSTTSRRYTGSQACSVLGKLGISAPAFEMKAGCSTSLASLHFGQALLAQGYGNVLVACAETLSKVIHPEVRETWFGLADGGAALWLESAGDGDAQFEVLKSFYSTDGRHVDLYTTPGDLPPRRELLEAGGYFLAGDSSQLKELARARYLQMIEALLPDRAQRASVKWIVPHQVNRLLVEEVRKESGLGGEWVWSAEEFGNIGGASVLFSLAQALEERRFRPGDLIFLMSVGGGLSFAAQLWRVLR